MNKVIEIQKEVNPHFKSVWKTKTPYNVLRGGRNSFKSSVIALLLIYMLIPFLNKGEKANIVIIRKVASTIRDSVFLKMQWALNKFGILDQFHMTVAPFKIMHKRTGSTIYFYGQDDFQKLKSNDIGDIIGVWYEEAAEFRNSEEFDQTNITFMRQKHPLADMVRFFWSYNPPRNPYSWINEWTEAIKHDKGYNVHNSSYLDDVLGFVTPQMLDEINRIKENDYDYYRYLYLGEPVGLGTNVYNMDLFKPLSELPTNDRIVGLYFATDTGHQVSATSTLAFGLTLKRNVILLDTYYYSPAGVVKKKAPSDLTEELHAFYEKVRKKYNIPIYQKTIDSAEGGIRNQYFKDFNERLHPVAKGKKVDMVDYVQDLLAQGRFYYLNIEANKIFIEEHKKYQWDERTVKSDKPEVLKEDDHTCDCFQYFVKDNLRTLQLKA
ncbi:MAG: PBSX family phage terminase large subunit [Alkalibacterium sp.]|nr:PBSX family phage terminase large subunit [Alkalibacterium sp.]